MTSPNIFALPRSDLNGFLFAEVGIEIGGNRLSVLSAFARIGLDPWQEASRLSRLARPCAVAALVSRLEEFDSDIALTVDPPGVAATLVALLPGHRAEFHRLPLTPAGSVRTIFSVNLASTCLAVIAYCVVLFLLCHSGGRGSDIRNDLRNRSATGSGRPAGHAMSAPPRSYVSSADDPRP